MTGAALIICTTPWSLSFVLNLHQLHENVGRLVGVFILYYALLNPYDEHWGADSEQRRKV